MGSCCWFPRKLKVAELDPPSDVKEAFKQYSDDGIHMTVDHLQRFLQECQEECIHKRHPITWLKKRNTLTLDDFHYYLFNSQLNPPISSMVHHDMTAPFSHYFIYTGHNSFLTGNQLSDPCSDVLIINALKRGIRVIELELRPNSSKDDVDVFNGRFRRKPVELVRCLKSIKEHAFTASPYPVVITLEDHLTPDLQSKVAQMLIETFGDMLFAPESELEELPSPESLKKRILISVKPLKEYIEAEEDKHTKPQRVKEPSRANKALCGRTPHPATFIHNLANGLKYESDDDNKDSENHIKIPDSCSGYKNLIALHAGKPNGGLEEELNVEKDKARRISLAEQALGKATERHQQQILRFTQRNILSVYRQGSHLTFSKYKPLMGWLHGVQMIALNMEGYGRSLWLMHGMFRANGGCGYVKKPDFLMLSGPDNQVFDPKAKLPVKTTLKVKVYMGEGWHLDFQRTHFDANSPPNFYTRVAISGAPADEIVRETKPKEDTWTPVWNQEFTFELTLPEMALLLIEVHEYDTPGNDGFAGQTCLPVSELRPGIRAVPLCDREGCLYTATRLLVRFKFVS